MIQLLLDAASQTVDLQRPDGTLILSSELLDTVVMVSLFTRQQADSDDELPEPKSHREGWWADPYADERGYKIGSKLWLLGRSKTTRATLNKARIYSRDALQWMIDDGIVEEIEVEVERQENGRCAFRVEIPKPDDPASRWVGVWEAHLSEL